MRKTVYLVEYGKFLDKNDREYSAYTSAYDRQRSYCDAGQYYVDNLVTAMKDAEGYLNGGKSAEGTYAVVSRTWLPYDVETTEAVVEDEDYKPEDVFYSGAILDGKLTENFIEGQQEIHFSITPAPETLPERIFWMNRNQQGLYESGCPMTLEQLKEEFAGDDSFDLDVFLSGDTFKEMEGEFRGDDTFTIMEVQSLRQLKALMTWEDFDFEESHASGAMDEEYPDFVDESLRCSRYIYELTGYTRNELPLTGGKNPTVEKYCALLWLEEKDLEAKVTDFDRAKKDIADVLHYGEELTPERYNEILNDNHLDYLTIDEREPDYTVRSYYDSELRGLADMGTYTDWREVVDFAHNELSAGSYVRITNDTTGQSVELNPDDYDKEFNGEFPVSPEDLEQENDYER